MAGLQKDHLDLVESLIELDYDAIEAYRAAIDRIEEDELAKIELAKFMADHERHVNELSTVLVAGGRRAPDRGDIKRVLTKGKVVLMGLAGDRAILMAMKSNEEDTNTAYERAVERNLPAPLGDILVRNLADERRHRAWIVERLGHRSEAPSY